MFHPNQVHGPAGQNFVGSQAGLQDRQMVHGQGATPTGHRFNSGYGVDQLLTGEIHDRGGQAGRREAVAGVLVVEDSRVLLLRKMLSMIDAITLFNVVELQMVVW